MNSRTLKVGEGETLFCRLLLSQLIRSSYKKEDRFPPELSCSKKWVLTFVDGTAVAALVIVVNQMFFHIFPSSIGAAYIGLGVVLAGLFADRYFRHKILVHKSRLEDRSEVDALIVEARTVEPRMTNPEKPDDYDKRKQEIEAEADRLEKELGPKGWTEYQVLSLNRMLVDFLKLDDLKARARSSLAELEDYAQDSAYRYDQKHYDDWKQSINDATERLRAELRTLLEHVADYHANWAEGSAVVRGLMICGAAAIPILLVMGLLPVLHPMGDGNLGVLGWGILGISGSVTAVLLYLYNSNLVEVGNTEGKNELWCAALGAALGLVASVLIFAIFRGELLKGAAVPNLEHPEMKDIGLSILWAVGSGMFFESVFQRVRSTVERGS